MSGALLSLYGAAGGGGGGGGLDSISFTAWSDVADDFGAPAGGNNEDRTLSWSVGGARNISCNYAGSETLQYRINTGSWTTYAGAFALSSGQTLAWKYIASANESGTIVPNDDTKGESLVSFGYSATGW